MEINKESEANEMEDSGFVQEEALKMKNLYSEQQDMSDTEQCPLLDLSDELLLYILGYLKPQDLKALGFTCARLGSLVLDRSLWTVVDATGEEVGCARLDWYLTHALTEHTRELRLRGYAAGVDGCKGAVSCTRAEYMQIEEEAKEMSEMLNPSQEEAHQFSAAVRDYESVERRFLMSNEGRLDCILPAGGQCLGTQYTVDEPLLRRLAAACPHLTTLALDHCNIDGEEVQLHMFPRTLKHLSLRGSRVYNPPSTSGFLHQISVHLPDLEFVDVSECEWMAPLMLMGLGKLRGLRELRAARCRKMIEFVAYASLAARGFPALVTLDLRGSPVGNSEVSAWAAVGTLRALHLSAPPAAAPARRQRRHAHYRDEQRSPQDELAPWEREEPPYYKVDGDGASKKPSKVSGYVDEEGAWVDLGTSHVNYGHNYAWTTALRRVAELQSAATLQNENENAGERGSGSVRDSGNENVNKRKNEDGEPDPSDIKRTRPALSVENRISVERASESVSASGNGSVSGSDRDSSKRKTEDTEPCPSSGKRNCSVVAEGNGMPDGRVVDNTSGSVNGSGSGSDDSSKRKNFDTESAPSDAKRIRADAGEENGTLSISGSGSESGSDSSKRKNFDTESGPSDAKRIRAVAVEENGTLAVNGSGSGSDSGSDSSKRKNFDTESGPSDAKRIRAVAVEENGTLAVSGSGSGSGSGSDSSKRKNFDTESGPSDAKRIRAVAVKVKGTPAVSGSGSGSDSSRQANGTEAGPSGARVPAAGEFRRHGCVIDGALGSRVSCACGPGAARRPWQLGGMVLRAPAHHPADLVTDVAIQRFGYSDHADQRYVTISRRGIADAEPRRERSALTDLTVSGYRRVTDRTLTHLSTAAPHLRYLDVRGTAVTAAGVDAFKSLRPDCRVLYTPHDDVSG